MRDPFMAAILPLSKRQNMDALLEWELYGVDEASGYGAEQCSCSHRIKHIFLIRNTVTGAETVAGSCCIRRVGAKNLMLRWQGKKQYLISAEVMAKTKRDKALVEGAMMMFAKWGTRLRLTSGHASELKRITKRKWRWVWDG